MLFMLELQLNNRSHTMTARLRPIAFAACVFAALGTGPALAQSMRAGLWQMSGDISVEGQPGKIQRLSEAYKKSMAALPPADRKSIDDDAASRHQQITDQGFEVQFCLTPAMVALHQVLFGQLERCSVKQSASGAGTVHFSYSCADDGSSGEGTVTFSGTTGFKEEIRAASYKQHGTPIPPMTVVSSGRWLAADCGSVKPDPDEEQAPERAPAR